MVPSSTFFPHNNPVRSVTLKEINWPQVTLVSFVFGWRFDPGSASLWIQQVTTTPCKLPTYHFHFCHATKPRSPLFVRFTILSELMGVKRVGERDRNGKGHWKIMQCCSNYFSPCFPGCACRGARRGQSGALFGWCGWEEYFAARASWFLCPLAQRPPCPSSPPHKSFSSQIQGLLCIGHLHHPRPDFGQQAQAASGGRVNVLWYHHGGGQEENILAKLSLVQARNTVVCSFIAVKMPTLLCFLWIISS